MKTLILVQYLFVALGRESTTLFATYLSLQQTLKSERHSSSRYHLYLTQAMKTQMANNFGSSINRQDSVCIEWHALVPR